MPALADLPEIIGFFSYSRDDDRDTDNSLTTIRRAIQGEMRARLGRSGRTLRLWQDEEAIPPGAMWEGQIRIAIDQSVFFIPIITPRVLNSGHCGREFEAFLEREKQLGRDDLVFPILYIDVEELEDESRWRGHPVLEVIGTRQYVDWREYRFEPDGPALRRGVAAFAAKIVSTLRRPMPEPRPVEAKTPLENQVSPPKVPETTASTNGVVPMSTVAPIVSPPAALIPHDAPMPAPSLQPILTKTTPFDLRKWSLIVGLIIFGVVGLIVLLGALMGRI
jgi:hypothetical protein